MVWSTSSPFVHHALGDACHYNERVSSLRGTKHSTRTRTDTERAKHCGVVDRENVCVEGERDVVSRETETESRTERDEKRAFRERLFRERETGENSFERPVRESASRELRNADNGRCTILHGCTTRTPA